MHIHIHSSVPLILYQDGRQVTRRCRRTGALYRPRIRGLLPRVLGRQMRASLRPD